VNAITPSAKRAYPFLGGGKLLSLDALLLVSHLIMFNGVSMGAE
jgi:hypothetical protein